MFVSKNHILSLHVMNSKEKKKSNIQKRISVLKTSKEIGLREPDQNIQRCTSLH